MVNKFAIFDIFFIVPSSEVSEDTANKWKAAGLVEIESGGDRMLEVATPGDTPAEQAEQAEQADTTAKSKKAK